MNRDQRRDTTAPAEQDGGNLLPNRQTNVRGGSEKQAEQGGVPTGAAEIAPQELEKWQRELMDLGRHLCQTGEQLITMVAEMTRGARVRSEAEWDDHEPVEGWRAMHRGGPSGLHMDLLTPSERATLALYGRGLSYDEIAHVRGVRPSTVSEQLKSARAKLDAASSAQAVAKARKLGLVD